MQLASFEPFQPQKKSAACGMQAAPLFKTLSLELRS
jgi:hypothetical protein